MIKGWKLLAMLAVFALVVASCGDDSGSTTTAAADDDTTATTAAADDDTTATTAAADDDGGDVTQGTTMNTASVHVCAIGGADQFFSVVKNGADLAGGHVEDFGSEYTWLPLPTYDNIGPDMDKLEREAIAQNCTSLAVPVWAPDAQLPALQEAIDAGIAVFLYNAGLENMATEGGPLDALGYFGTDEYAAGVAAGTYFVEQGFDNVRCVNTQPSAVNWQQRCGGLVDGAKAAGGNGDQIIMTDEDFGNASAITSAVQAALTADDSINGFATGAAADADAVNAALESMGATAAQGGWDVSANIMDRIQNGEALFAVDQQGWYQGWLAVSQAWLYDQFAILPATPTILTGPALITADNVDKIKNGVLDGFR